MTTNVKGQREMANNRTIAAREIELKTDLFDWPMSVSIRTTTKTAKIRPNCIDTDLNLPYSGATQGPHSNGLIKDIAITVFFHDTLTVTLAFCTLSLTCFHNWRMIPASSRFGHPQKAPAKYISFEQQYAFPVYMVRCFQ